MNDHPDQWPPAFPDRFFTDRLRPLYKWLLVNDHPQNTTNGQFNLNLTYNERSSNRWQDFFIT